MVYKLLFAWMENGAKPDLSLPGVKGGEGWVKGHCLPFTPSNALSMGISGQKVKGEGFSASVSFRFAGFRIRVQRYYKEGAVCKFSHAPHALFPAIWEEIRGCVGKGAGKMKIIGFFLGRVRIKS